MSFETLESPLFNEVDPNREFIKNAVRYLLAREPKDREVQAIFMGYFLKSEMHSDENLPDELEKQLTFRDQAVGDKLEALKAVMKMFRFMHLVVYFDYITRKDPRAKEFVEHINNTREALKVLCAPYVDVEWMRSMQESIEAEYESDLANDPDLFEPEVDSSSHEEAHQLH